MSVIGILFFPFLCIGIPLMIVASLLHQLRLAGRDRDLVLPELRDPRRHLSRRAMPLWPDSLLRRKVPP